MLQPIVLYYQSISFQQLTPFFLILNIRKSSNAGTIKEKLLVNSSAPVIKP